MSAGARAVLAAERLRSFPTPPHPTGRHKRSGIHVDHKRSGIDLIQTDVRRTCTTCTDGRTVRRTWPPGRRSESACPSRVGGASAPAGPGRAYLPGWARSLHAYESAGSAERVRTVRARQASERASVARARTAPAGAPRRRGLGRERTGAAAVGAQPPVQGAARRRRRAQWGRGRWDGR